MTAHWSAKIILKWEDKDTVGSHYNITNGYENSYTRFSQWLGWISKNLSLYIAFKLSLNPVQICAIWEYLKYSFGIFKSV